MANTLPINIPIPAESSVASYSWTDIANGLGYVDFYGFASTSTTGGTVSYHASPHAVFSKPTGVGMPDTTYNFLASAFNRPVRIGGTALIYIARGVTTGGSPSTAGLATTITIYKVSGVTETQIGTVVAKSISVSWDSGETMTPDVLMCTITNTSFKIGDYLKFSVIMDSTGGGANATAFSFDPSGADYSYYNGQTVNLTNTQLKFSIPFRIEL